MMRLCFLLRVKHMQAYIAPTRIPFNNYGAIYSTVISKMYFKSFEKQDYRCIGDDVVSCALSFWREFEYATSAFHVAPTQEEVKAEKLERQFCSNMID